MKALIHQARCPSCGANLPVPAGTTSIPCRYCQNVIEIEHAKAPPGAVPPPGVPTRKLYIDPAAFQKTRVGIGWFGWIIVIAVLMPVLLPLIFIGGPWAFHSCRSAIRPFPLECEMNETVEVSGDFTTTGPLVTDVGGNCKLHIKNSKLKASTLLDKSDAYNLEIWLDNVTLETTGTTIHAASNLKAKIHGSTITSTGGNVFDVTSGLDVEELTSSTLESTTGVALKTTSNPKVHAESSKIRGKKAGIDAQSGVELQLKKGCEITSSAGIAIKATSGMTLEAAEGGKLDGALGALVTDSSLTLDATSLALTAGSGPAIATTSSSKIDLTGGTVASKSTADPAIQADGAELTLAGTKIDGVDGAIQSRSSLKLRASKGAHLTAARGNGITTGSNCDLTIADAGVDAAGIAVRADVNAKIRLTTGARLAGKKGGIAADSNLSLDADGATIDGGGGAGIAATYSPKIALTGGLLKGNPALQLERSPSSLTISGARIDGAQHVPAR